MSFLHLVKVITAYRSTPFAKQVKQQTKEWHDKIETHPFVKKFISGTITDLEYAVYLNNLLSVYATVESRLFDATTPEEFFRLSHIIQDLSKYKKILNIGLDRYNFWSDWVESIKSGDDLTVVANFYIRWLGDMYGGQVISKNFKYNSMLKFQNVRKCIREARSLIESIGSKNSQAFIERVNEAYSYNYKLASDLQEIFHEKSL